MLYIEIPENMKFVCLERGDGKKEDHFIDCRDISELAEGEELLAPISVQQAVISFLETRKKVATVDGLNFNKKKPSKGTHIEYQIKDSGKNSTEHWNEWTPSPRLRVKAGQRWFNSPDVYLSPEKRAEVEEKSYEQKLNRQHIGDSPLAT